MSELINRWFSRTPRLPGMAACGMFCAEGAAFSKSWEGQYSEPVLDELWRRLFTIAEAAEACSAERLRWTFEGGVILAASRPGGPYFFILLPHQTGERDTAGVERLLAEFRGLRP